MGGEKQPAVRMNIARYVLNETGVVKYQKLLRSCAVQHPAHRWLDWRDDDCCKNHTLIQMTCNN